MRGPELKSRDAYNRGRYARERADVKGSDEDK